MKNGIKYAVLMLVGMLLGGVIIYMILNNNYNAQQQLLRNEINDYVNDIKVLNNKLSEKESEIDELMSAANETVAEESVEDETIKESETETGDGKRVDYVIDFGEYDGPFQVVHVDGLTVNVCTNDIPSDEFITSVIYAIDKLSDNMQEKYIIKDWGTDFADVYVDQAILSLYMEGDKYLDDYNPVYGWTGDSRYIDLYENALSKNGGV